MKELEELAVKKETPGFVNLLSLDGGGIRGLVIIQVMIVTFFFIRDLIGELDVRL